MLLFVDVACLAGGLVSVLSDFALLMLPCGRPRFEKYKLCLYVLNSFQRAEHYYLFGVEHFAKLEMF